MNRLHLKLDRRKDNPMKTVANILKEGSVGDVLSDGKRKWKIVTLDFDDGCVVAIPIKNCDFELWSYGVESVAIIPDLKIIKNKK